MRTDHSTTDDWHAANDRFHHLMRATDEVAEHLDAFREFVRQEWTRDIGRDPDDPVSWTAVPARRIDVWCEWLAQYDATERAYQVEARLVYARDVEGLGPFSGYR